MDIILISHSRGRTWRLRCQPRSPLFWAPLVSLPVIAICAAMVFGYRMAPDASGVTQVASATAVWDEQVAVQRQEVQSLRQRMDDNIHALAQRLGQLQAHVTRLNAAGSRMTKLANIDAREFDFASPPPLGGPIAETDEQAPTADQFEAALDRFEKELDSRERQMRVLRDLMLASELREEMTPSGRPVNEGWISSAFGWRTDPFSGRRSMHEGIDFAAGVGTDVVSVAPGVVSHAGGKAGYGKLVEVNHGNGYVTRYGHNSKITVEVGERVDRGNVIAKLGSSGRSTGPHLHFEVLRNGKVVDPAAYMEAAR